jgi:hypothetical protein
VSCFINWYTECHYAECCYADWHVLFIAKRNVIMMSVVMPSAIMISVIMLCVIRLSVGVRLWPAVAALATSSFIRSVPWRRYRGSRPPSGWCRRRKISVRTWSDPGPTWDKRYKTFYGSNLQMLQISSSVCLYQIFSVKSNACRQSPSLAKSNLSPCRLLPYPKT